MSNRMRYGIDVAPLGGLAEPARIVELARAAEAAGWEALFVWDHLAFVWGMPSADPWVVLAAVAQATQRIRLGTAVTPLARRRPAVVAAQVATLDRLSGDSPAAYRRAARWDGWIAAGDNEQGEMVMPTEKIASLAGRFDIALTGASSGPDDPVLADYERAGVTWWLEHLHERRGAQADLIARIEAGPVTSRP